MYFKRASNQSVVVRVSLVASANKFTNHNYNNADLCSLFSTTHNFFSYACRLLISMYVYASEHIFSSYPTESE